MENSTSKLKNNLEIKGLMESIRYLYHSEETIADFYLQIKGFDLEKFQKEDKIYALYRIIHQYSYKYGTYFIPYTCTPFVYYRGLYGSIDDILEFLEENKLIIIEIKGIILI